MVESFRLINRYGMKIWVSTLFGGATVAVLLLTPHLFMGLLLGPELDALLAKGRELLSSPGSWRSVAGGTLHTFLNGGKALIGYGLLLSLFTLLSFSFFTSGLLGMVRQAAMENRVSLGHFFSFGFRYLLRMPVLVFIQLVIWISLQAGVWFSWPLIPVEWYWQTLFFVIVALVFLTLIAAFCHGAVVLFVEGMGVIRSFACGFKVVFRRFGVAVGSLLGALFAGIGGMVALAFFSLFPWLILQLLDDGAVATIVGVVFGGLLLLLLGSFPAIFSTVVLFQRYINRIQDTLFPENRLKPTLLHPRTRDEEAAATREPVDSF